MYIYVNTDKQRIAVVKSKDNRKIRQRIENYETVIIFTYETSQFPNYLMSSYYSKIKQKLNKKIIFIP